MSDIQDYIESGVIEEYCLGLLSGEEVAKLNRMAALHPAIQQEIEITQATLRKYAVAQLASTAVSKAKFLDTITNLTAEENLKLNHLPLISPYSDAKKWFAAVSHLTPEIKMEDCLGYVLTMNEKLEQYLIWLDNELVEDGHDAIQESFLILDGTCECNFEGRIVNLAAGDFLDIPKFTHHTIRNTSPNGAPIKAIVQRVLEAA